MNAAEKVINDLNVAKLTLCHPQMLTPEMCVRIGQAITSAIDLLKECEQRRRLEVHNIGNVDIPDGVTWEKFQAVMNNVVDALEHTDRGESWPYEDKR